jgi:serine/threonine protein kinase
LKLSKSTLKFEGNTTDLYKSRTSAIYTPENGIPAHVLVEWKYHTYAEDDFDHISIYRDIESIVGLLYKTSQPKDFRALTCLGYIEDYERFGIVYKKPEIADQQLDPVSLSDLLADDDNEHVPDLEDRFRLAYTLANSIHEFHSMGWLHKNINSHNILFFRTHSPSATTISGIDISSPFIAGFDFSRHITAETMPPTITRAYELYCHPSYLRDGSFASGFRRKYDIYSLGLVLFEIGVWKRLEDFRVPEGSREGLLIHIESKYIQWLGPSMGSTYRTAVMACLKGTYWPLPDDSQSFEELTEFRTRVLWALGRCSA